MEQIKEDAPLAALVQKFSLELQKIKEQKIQADQASVSCSRNIDRYEGAILGVQEAAKIIATKDLGEIEQEKDLNEIEQEKEEIID